MQYVLAIKLLEMGDIDGSVFCQPVSGRRVSDGDRKVIKTVDDVGNG